jgi:UDP-GlcNAc:undecaprenyl-phosphate GlcNAc-1-phosphate transferase
MACLAVNLEFQRTLGEILQGRWWILFAALVASSIATPIFRHIAYRRKIVDRPDDLLKPHGRPVAYLGGLGICAGLLVGLGAYLLVMPRGSFHWSGLRRAIGEGNIGSVAANPLWNLLAIALAFVVITLVGLRDDLKGTRPRGKVLGQAAAAGILLLGGVGMRVLTILVAPVRFIVGQFSQETAAVMQSVIQCEWVLLPFSAAVCFLIVISACNATNLLDGLDGLCGGVTAIITLGFLALAVFLALYANVRTPGADELRVGLALAMAGAILGFLPYNIPPASIFMGDAGSMLLGFFVAVMMILFCEEGAFRWFLAACAVFALPILDTALAVVRRIRGRVSIFAGDRGHLYDQLVDRGLSVKQVVVLFYVLALAAAMLGVAIAISTRTLLAVLLYSLLFVVIWTVFGVMGMITPPGKTPTDKAPAKEKPTDAVESR